MLPLWTRRAWQRTGSTSQCKPADVDISSISFRDIQCDKKGKKKDFFTILSHKK